LLLTGPFTPMLFQGEEWGASTPFQYFTDHRDPDLGRAVSEGRRNEFAHFGWAPEDVPDPQAPETFTRSQLDWSERAQPEHESLLAWYRELLALRRRVTDLRDPRLDRTHVDVDEAAQTIVMTRGSVRVLVNLAPDARAFERAPHETVLAASTDIEARDDHVVVPADAVALLG
jgi:maltooligosyltrehalose trehalohydrolase